MNVYRDLYFATLTGAAGGLLAWILALLIGIPLSDRASVWLPDTVELLVFGVVVALLLYVWSDRTRTGKIQGGTFGWGLLFGLVSAGVAAGLAFALRRAIAPSSVNLYSSANLYRLAVWVLCFSIIGLGLGLRWVGVNRVRVLHTYVGSLTGGLLGGLVFILFSPHLNNGADLCGLMLAGAGTGFGAGIAPTLIRDGAMRFISSGDARAQSKLGRTGKFWDLASEESYVVGSAATTQGGTRFQQGADIVVPDAAIAPRHAVVFSKDGRYFIARHPDASGPEGIAKWVLRIKGKTVVTSQELHPSDDLLVGRTALRFESRKQGE